MKRTIIAAFAILFTLIAPHSVQARTVVAFGVGVGGGYAPYYPAYPAYYGYPYPAYYAPPPAVVYAAPPPVVYAQPSSLIANQTSPTFVDAAGRTCRRYQSVAGGVPAQGTACLEPDGIWRAMGG